MLNDAARTANVLNSAKKIRDYKNDAVRKQGLAMKTLLPYKTETYNFDPILKVYDDQKSSVMDSVDPIIKTQTDAKLAGQVRLAEADKLIELGDNVRKSMSEEISKKDAINRETHYKTDLENIARTDDNRRLGAEVASQVANNEAKYTHNKAAEINNILTEKQQRRAIGQQERAKVASLIEYNKALNDAQTKFSNIPKTVSDEDKVSYSNYLKNTLNEIRTTSEYNNSFNRNTYLRNDVFSSKPSILDFSS